MTATPQSALRLSEALATRLCHDLSGPVNTLLGVADVVADDPAAAAEAVGLMADAGQAMARRLRLCRAAWGSAAALSADGFTSLTAGLATKRLTIDLDRLDRSADFSAPAARLCLNVALLAAESVPRGGLLAMQGHPAGNIIVQIDGPGAAWPAGFVGLLADPNQAWAMLDDPARLQAPLTALLAQAAGLSMSLLMGATATPAPALLLRLGA